LEFAIEKTLNRSMPSIRQHSTEHHRLTNVSLPKNLNAYRSSTGARELIDNPNDARSISAESAYLGPFQAEKKQEKDPPCRLTYISRTTTTSPSTTPLPG
jgi:hypothetical protein